MKPFSIEFTYNGYPFKGTVSGKHNSAYDYYFVELKTENQQKYADLLAIPPSCQEKNWVFKSPGYRDAAEIFDQRLLMEISTCISVHLMNVQGSEHRKN